MTKHTPSPWHVEAEIVDGQVKYSIDQETVDESGDIERGEVRANCKLIAASPDLLEALTNAEKLLHGLYLNCTLDPLYEDEIGKQIDSIRHITSKATGE